MKKVLIVSSVASMIDQFNKDNMKILQNIGYEVSVATNFDDPGTISPKKSELLKEYLNNNNIKFYQINFSRNIFSIKSIIKSFKELNQLKRLNEFNLVHCHSPIGGVITRLVFKKSTTKIIYTAHGFQFFSGGSIKDWLLFYPIEKLLSKYTDILITINNTDYQLAVNKFKSKVITKIPGVGIKKPTSFDTNTINKIRNKYNIPSDGLLLCSIGELSKRKNHATIIESISKIDDKNIYYLICGRGKEKSNLEKLISNKGLDNRVQLLGYVDNVQDLLYASDISLFPSKREGLGLAGLESLSVGTPLISSNIQGIPDYSKNNFTGIVSPNNSVEEYREAIIYLRDDETLRKKMGRNGIEISKEYFQDNVNSIMEEIYKSVDSIEKLTD